MFYRTVLGGVLALLTAGIGTTQAADAPAEIKLGTLYASSGAFASISIPVHDGLRLWLDLKNAEGGVFVKAFNKKIPLKLVAYDDQSNTATAATLYEQLITQDKVDLLVSDGGSVLTSVAVPIARNHKMLLITQTGTGAAFYTPDNPYIVLTGAPVSSVWPKPVADFITHDGPALGIKRVAFLYATNDFTAGFATTMRKLITDANAGIEIVYDQGVPTSTSNFTVIINNIRAANPDAVIELGYPPNDIAFLRNLQDIGLRFKMLYSLYVGIDTELIRRNVGEKGMEYVYGFVTSSEFSYETNFGMTLPEYREAWHKKYTDGKVAFGVNPVVGYATGLIIEKALSVADSLDQLELRRAIFSLSRNLRTLNGTFELDPTGAQIGETTPLGQLIPDKDGHLHMVTVYPHDMATSKPVYPAP